MDESARNGNPWLVSLFRFLSFVDSRLFFLWEYRRLVSIVVNVEIKRFDDRLAIGCATILHYDFRIYDGKKLVKPVQSFPMNDWRMTVE